MRRPSSSRSLALTAALAAGIGLACGPKAPVEPPAPRLGWFQAEGWSASCWYPGDFEASAGGARRLMRSDAINQVIGQWRGTRNDGVRFPEELVTAIEITLLGNPERIEWVAAENAARCAAAMDGGGNLSRWQAWLEEVPARVREGLCPYAPLDYTLFDYLSIGSPWHITRPVCAGDEVDIKASSVDFYRIVENGPWITAAGDPAQPAIGTSLPCNLEGCLRGQLILKFEGDDGYRTVVPVGLGARFTAPGHGQISVQINDDTWFDNKWKVEGGIEHHTSIEYDGEN